MFLTNLVAGASPYKPSFFELAAQDRLVAGLKPAFKFLLQASCRWPITARGGRDEARPRCALSSSPPQFVARHHPSLAVGVKNHEEFFAVLMFFLERHFLEQYGG